MVVIILVLWLLYWLLLRTDRALIVAVKDKDTLDLDKKTRFNVSRSLSFFLLFLCSHFFCECSNGS
jgi:hypothetical protein